MNENVKYITRLSAGSALSFIKITALTGLTTAVVLVAGLILLSNDVDVGSSGHVSAIPFLVMMFVLRPVGSVLWALAITVVPAMLFALGNKYIISKAASRLVKDKSETLIVPILDKALLKLQSAPPAGLQKAGGMALSKLQIIQSIKDDKTANKWLRRIVVLGLKKVNLNEVDLSADPAKLGMLLKSRAIESLQNLVAPSKTGIWLLIGFQWTVLLFIWATNY